MLDGYGLQTKFRCGNLKQWISNHQMDSWKTTRKRQKEKSMYTHTETMTCIETNAWNENSYKYVKYVRSADIKWEKLKMVREWARIGTSQQKWFLSYVSPIRFIFFSIEACNFDHLSLYLVLCIPIHKASLKESLTNRSHTVESRRLSKRTQMQKWINQIETENKGRRRKYQCTLSLSICVYRMCI